MRIDIIQHFILPSIYTMPATLPLPAKRRLPKAPAHTQSLLAMPAHKLLDLSVDSTELLRGNKSISIVHNGAVYRLQSTKLGKLILTK